MTDHQNENNRAKNFVLHIPEEEMQYGAPSESGEKESLSSFSDGHPRQPKADKKAVKKEKREAKKEHRRRNRIKGGRNRWTFRLVWLVMVLLLGMTMGLYLVDGTNDLLGATRTGKGTVSVPLPEDPTVDDVAQALYEAGAIQNVEFFKLYCKVTSNEDYFSGGAYELDASWTMKG